MKDTNKSATLAFKVARITAAVLLIALVAASAISFTLGFDDSLRYFNGSPINLPFVIISILTVILALASLFLFKGRIVRREKSLISGIAAMLPAIALMILVLKSSWDALIAFGAQEKGDRSFDVWTVLAIVTALLSILYAITELLDIGKSTKLLAGYGQIIFCVITIAKFYLDFSVELNSPVKLIIQFAAAAMVLCTLADLRELLGRASASFFVASRILSVALGIISAFLLSFEIIPSADLYSADYETFTLVFALLAIKSCFELFSVDMGETIPKERDEVSESDRTPDEESNRELTEEADEAYDLEVVTEDNTNTENNVE